jgi:hypothetical protein
MTYGHRNGETEPPTIAGYYGFMRKGLRHGWIVTVVQYDKHGEMRSYSGTLHDEEYRELEPGQWWGPIEGPWASKETDTPNG